MANRGPVLRIIGVMTLAAWGLFFSIGLLSSFGPNTGYYGIYSGDGLTVDSVDRETSADKAGIAPGDTLDERHTPFNDRRAAGWGWQLPATGAHEMLRIIHNGVSRTVTVNAARALPYLDGSFRVNLVSQTVVGSLFIILGALLVLLRPSKMTWAFFIYCVGINPVTSEPISWLYWVPHWLFFTLIVVTDFLRYGGYAAIAIFAARFPHDRPAGKLQQAIQTGALLFFAIFIVQAVYWDIAAAASKATPRLFNDAANVAINLVYFAALVAFIATYRQANASVKQRTRWVIVGLAVGVGVRAMLHIPEDMLNLNLPSWVYVLQTFLSLAVPVSVVYSIMKYRVFDITFVVSRALAITIISSVFLAVFAIIDGLFHLSLASSNVGLTVEVGAAIGLSLSLHGLRRWMTRFTDRVLFRHRHVATQRLTEIALQLLHADSSTEVEQLLLNEPRETLTLQFAALFARSADDSFQRTSVIGEPLDLPSHLDPHDPLTQKIVATTETGAIRLQDISHSQTHQKLSEHTGPALALPIMVHRKLNRLVLYGHHQSGADFDPDEIRSVTALASGASAAYDHLETQALRQRLEDAEFLRAENEELRLENEALKAAKIASTSITVPPKES